MSILLQSAAKKCYLCFDLRVFIMIWKNWGRVWILSWQTLQVSWQTLQQSWQTSQVVGKLYNKVGKLRNQVGKL